MIGVAQNLQAEQLGVGLVGGAGGILLLLLHLLLCGGLAVVGVCGNAGAAAHVSDVEGEHFAVGYGELLESLFVVGEEGTVEVEVLGGGVDVGLGMDGASECFEGHLWEDLEGEQVGVHLVGLRDVECDTHLDCSKGGVVGDTLVLVRLRGTKMVRCS